MRTDASLAITALLLGLLAPGCTLLSALEETSTTAPPDAGTTTTSTPPEMGHDRLDAAPDDMGARDGGPDRDHGVDIRADGDMPADADMGQMAGPCPFRIQGSEALRAFDVVAWDTFDDTAAFAVGYVEGDTHVVIQRLTSRGQPSGPAQIPTRPQRQGVIEHLALAARDDGGLDIVAALVSPAQEVHMLHWELDGSLTPTSPMWSPVTLPNAPDAIASLSAYRFDQSLVVATAERDSAMAMTNPPRYKVVLRRFNAGQYDRPAEAFRGNALADDRACEEVIAKAPDVQLGPSQSGITALWQNLGDPVPSLCGTEFTADVDGAQLKRVDSTALASLPNPERPDMYLIPDPGRLAGERLGLTRGSETNVAGLIVPETVDDPGALVFFVLPSSGDSILVYGNRTELPRGITYSALQLAPSFSGNAIIALIADGQLWTSIREGNSRVLDIQRDLVSLPGAREALMVAADTLGALYVSAKIGEALEITMVPLALDDGALACPEGKN